MPKYNAKITRKPMTRRKATKENDRLALRDLADALEQVRSNLLSITVQLDGLYKRLYTTGLTERGPITEQKDDIPF